MEQFNNTSDKNTTDSNTSNLNNNSEITGGAGVEEITTGLDRMNVDTFDSEILDHYHHTDPSRHDHVLSNQATQQCLNRGDGICYSGGENSHSHSFEYYDELSMSLDDGPDSRDPIILTRSERLQQNQLTQQRQPNNQQQNMSSILIATNVDSSVFIDDFMKSRFESLFTNYDQNVTFRYLKSFRRVRLDFTNPQTAETARSNLAEFRLGNTEFKCYSAQFIKPNYNSSSQDSGMTSTHLNIPKLTKQFLISPPASPPVGWEPVNENSPCIDVQLISAIANLVPGKVHEIHAGNESQPGIFVEVCEDAQFESSMAKTCSIIPKTMNPAGLIQQSRNCTSVSMNH